MSAVIEVHRDEAVLAVLRRCYSDVEVRDRAGNQGLGVTNLKRLYGRPSELRLVVEVLAATVGPADALASADSGSAPLAALVAYRLGLPAVFVRSTPKEHLLSYGGDPEQNDPRLAGERLAAAATVHVVDDLVYSGATLCEAVTVVRSVDLIVRTASCLVASADLGKTVGASGLERMDALALTSDFRG